MAFGRKRRGLSGHGLPRGLACLVQRAVDDIAGPGAERAVLVATRLAQHFLDQAASIGFGRPGLRLLIRTDGTGTGAENQETHDPDGNA